MFSRQFQDLFPVHLRNIFSLTKWRLLRSEPISDGAKGSLERPAVFRTQPQPAANRANLGFDLALLDLSGKPRKHFWNLKTGGIMIKHFKRLWSGSHIAAFDLCKGAVRPKDFLILLIDPAANVRPQIRDIKLFFCLGGHRNLRGVGNFGDLFVRAAVMTIAKLARYRMTVRWVLRRDVHIV